MFYLFNAHMYYRDRDIAPFVCCYQVFKGLWENRLPDDIRKVLRLGPQGLGLGLGALQLTAYGICSAHAKCTFINVVLTMS